MSRKFNGITLGCTLESYLHGSNAPMSKKSPLYHLAIIIWTGLGIECELLLCIVMVGEIQDDGRRLEDDKIVPQSVH
jgi:hypothetical protein